MSDQSIKPGDVVKLASGGPAMTVRGLNKDGFSAACSWFHEGEVKYEPFLITTLRKLESSPMATKKKADQKPKPTGKPKGGAKPKGNPPAPMPKRGTAAKAR